LELGTLSFFATYIYIPQHGILWEGVGRKEATEMPKHKWGKMMIWSSAWRKA